MTESNGGEQHSALHRDEEKYLIIVLSINSSDEDVGIILNALLYGDYETKILID